VAEIARAATACGALCHSDAVQAAGKVPVDVGQLGLSLLSLSSHKLHGPKGAGALYVRRGIRMAPLMHGGRQERSLRPGTENVPGIVGFGKAAELCRVEMAADTARLGALRDRLNKKLHDGLDEIYINGSVEHRLPHNLNISFAYVEGESLLMGINDVAVSSGSACTSASLEPSYVLKALGAGDDLAHSSIRFGLGRWTTEEEIDYVAAKMISVVTRLREMSPLYELAKEGVDLTTMQWVVH
jgi:cysteine desulfurase